MSWLNAYRKNMVDVLAVTNCNRSLYAISTFDIMLERYGIDCPIGRAKNDQKIHAEEYAREVDNCWIARCELDPTRVQSATKILRKALADAKQGGYKIKLIILGMFNDIYNLWQSEGDEISNKNWCISK